MQKLKSDVSENISINLLFLHLQHNIISFNKPQLNKILFSWESTFLNLHQ